MQNLSKCIRQLFFLATYSPLIQIGPSKLLINSVPAAVAAEIRISMDACAYAAGMALEVQGVISASLLLWVEERLWEYRELQKGDRSQ